MGTLDAILGNLMGMAGGQPQAFGAPARPQGASMGPAGAAGSAALVAMVLQLLQRNGGIQGVLGRFQQAGYGDQAQSWISTGGNQPIDGDMFQKALTGGGIGQIASMLGLSRAEASSQMASVMPDVIDRMTPDGRVPEEENDVLSQGLAMLMGKPGRA
jgi:uncharacterized protein YidB (DUF937 family)